MTASRRVAPRAARTAGRGATRASGRGSGSGASRRRDPVVVRRGPAPETVLVASVALLCGIGLLMVFSASQVLAVEQTGSSWSIVARQAAWMVVGVGALLLAARVPLEMYRDRVGPLLMVLAVAGLGWIALDLVAGRLGGGLPLAASVNGASRWLVAGPVQFQPSELAKPALILWLARLLADRRRDLSTWAGLQPVLLAAFGVMGLVIIGDDLGTTMLLGVVLLVMLWMGGAPLRTVGSLLGVFLAAAAMVITLFQGFRAQRITAFLHPDDHTSAAGYQLLQSQIGLASGGLFGSGPGFSRAKWGFLPEAHTDFILAVIGEELGLVGSLFVIGLFVAFMWAGCTIAMRSRSLFGRLVAFGVTTWIGLQALINIGVTVGTMPTKGITLPFVSYGGSSLLMSLFGVGILLSVARAR